MQPRLDGRMLVISIPLAFPDVSAAAGVSVETSEGVMVFANPTWIGAVWLAVTLVGIALAVRVMVGTGKWATRPARILLGLLMIGALLLGGVGGAMSRFLEKVSVSDSSARIRVGFWPFEQIDLDFDDIRAIQSQQEVKGSGKSRQTVRSAVITRKTGGAETVQVNNDVLQLAWPEIVKRAAARGVAVSGGPFTD